jgi:short-subunit dehydrogenase
MTHVILITGASGGIGESLARQLAAKKYNLLLVARSEEKLQKLCRELSNKNGILSDYIIADLSQPDGPKKILAEAYKKNLSVMVLVNNAGTGSSGEFARNELQHEFGILQVNNSSMVALCHMFLPAMIKDGSGSIINIGSIASFFPSPYMAVYAASKAFVRSFTQALTEECRPYNIHVLFVAPGLTTSNFMNTSANDNAWGKVLTEGAPTQTPDQVAAEIIEAWEKKKTSHVSGMQNKIAVKLTALIPNLVIAAIFARQKRKKINS